MIKIYTICKDYEDNMQTENNDMTSDDVLEIVTTFFL